MGTQETITFIKKLYTLRPKLKIKGGTQEIIIINEKLYTLRPKFNINGGTQEIIIVKISDSIISGGTQ